LYGQGYPTYNVSYRKAGADSLEFIFNQTTSMPSVTPFFKGLVEYKITSDAGDTTILVNHTANNEQIRIKYSKIPTGVVVDPNNWIINKASVTLPVKLVSFKASVVNNEGSLNWITTDEVRLKVFVVEKSIDGLSFSKIGEVKPSTSSLPEKKYSYTDKNLAGRSFYRLKIIDEDGSANYSNVIELKNNKEQISIAYNNLMSLVTINTQLARPAKVEIALYNVDGKKLMRQEKQFGQGNNQLTLSLENFAKGIYIIEVMTQDERKVLKVSR
jgi:hypothetical protein